MVYTVVFSVFIIGMRCVFSVYFVVPFYKILREGSGFRKSVWSAYLD
jgi:hypothetical protein